MIPRHHLKSALDIALGRSPVAALLGPRQCGKTTLARHFAEARKDEFSETSFFDLESPVDMGRLANPQMALGRLVGLIVIDEIQQWPDLFKVLRVLADRDPLPARFLILGSASPNLVQHSAETLAGRVELIEMGGFDMDEVGTGNLERLWIQGSFPRSYLADSEDDSAVWRENFVRTFLERDIPQLGLRIPSTTLRRFWTMLAHYHGQTWNGAELGRALGVDSKTVRSYLDTLTGTFMVRQLQPWFENLGKRQVKAPKVYVRDSGLVHTLLGIRSFGDLLAHPKCGASWEGFAVEQVLHRTAPSEAYFWAVHSGAELDLLLFKEGRRIGFELKVSEAPKVTRAMHVAIEDLRLDHLWVVYPGRHRFPLDEMISAVPLEQVPSSAAELSWNVHRYSGKAAAPEGPRARR